MDLAEAEKLTTDPVALELLTDDSLAIIDPGDPFFAETTRLSNKIAALTGRLPSKRLQILRKLLQGRSRQEIIEELSTSYPTIKAATDSQEGQEYLSASLRLQRLRRGPAIDARAAMLWRIACDNEENQPRVSISAIDTLNRQEGVYTNDPLDRNAGVVIKINEFVINNAEPRQVEQQSVTVEGEFKPVTVEIPNDGK
jgi:hypothetical protein